MRRRWPALILLPVGLALLAIGVGDWLADYRIRMHTIIRLDGPASPEVLRLNGLELSFTGSRIREVQSDGVVVVRAWAPNPAVRVVEPGDRDEVRLRIDNVLRRGRLGASGPVEETGAGPSRSLRFSPRLTRRLAFVAPDAEVTFAVLGDTGLGPTFPEALRIAAAGGADFLLHVGDVVYEDEQMPGIARILAEAPLPVFVVRGNHDYRNRARIDFMRALGPPYYTFQIGGATFIVLDNAGDYLPWLWRRSTQYRWWTDALGAPRDGPLFVAMHKPIFDRRGGTSRAGMTDEAFGRRLLSDFVRAGVDAVFTGHVHETHLWTEDGIPFVINGEGFESRTGPEKHRMGWVRVRGWEVRIEQLPIWNRGAP